MDELFRDRIAFIRDVRRFGFRSLRFQLADVRLVGCYRFLADDRDFIAFGLDLGLLLGPNGPRRVPLFSPLHEQTVASQPKPHNAAIKHEAVQSSPEPAPNHADYVDRTEDQHDGHEADSDDVAGELEADAQPAQDEKVERRENRISLAVHATVLSL